MSGRRVVVTGRGVVSPLGVGADSHWAALLADRMCIGPVAPLEELGLSPALGAPIEPKLLEPHLNRLPRKQQKLYNRATLLAMLAAALAMDDAGLPPGAGEPERFGVLLGVNALSWDLGAMTDYLAAAESTTRPGTLDMVAANGFCMRSINPLDYSLKTLPNLAAGHLAIAHDAQGICRAMTEGPMGGAQAIGQGFRMIQEGDLEVALCGGTDAQLEALFFASYCGAGLLASAPGEGKGLVVGEGCGIVVLEEAERARRRGAPIHGEVLAFANAAGEGRLANEDDPARVASRLTSLIEAAVAETGQDPDVISVHGDGIPTHDSAESLALAWALGGRLAGRPRLRFKLAHGDLGAASGAVEFLACSNALKHDILPPIVASDVQECRRSLRRALVISLGLFGECATLVVGSARGPNAG